MLRKLLEESMAVANRKFFNSLVFPYRYVNTSYKILQLRLSILKELAVVKELVT
jgi:hypothetical protein